MPSLLSEQDRLDIVSAIQDVTDTFLQKPLVYQRFGPTVDRFQENRKSNDTPTTYNVKGLVVFQSSSDAAKITIKDEKGAVDVADGYILFNMYDLIPIGLIDGNDNFIGKTNSDFVIYQTQKLRIYGQNLLGQLVERNSLVKLPFKKIIQNG